MLCQWSLPIFDLIFDKKSNLSILYKFFGLHSKIHMFKLESLNLLSLHLKITLLDDFKLLYYKELVLLITKT